MKIYIVFAGQNAYQEIFFSRQEAIREAKNCWWNSSYVVEKNLRGFTLRGQGRYPLVEEIDGEIIFDSTDWTNKMVDRHNIPYEKIRHARNKMLSFPWRGTE